MDLKQFVCVSNLDNNNNYRIAGNFKKTKYSWLSNIFLLHAE